MSKSKLLTFLLIFLSFSAIFSFYNFDSASAQGVTWTYNSDTNTATASGSGNTNFAELVQADIDGGWGGVYTADSTGRQIQIAGRIVIGDGTNACAFADTSKQIIIKSGILSSYDTIIILVASASSFTLGTLNDATTHTTSYGCQIYMLDTTYRSFIPKVNNGGTANFYGCSFNSVGSGGSRQYIGGYGVTLYNCNLVNFQLNELVGGDFYNVFLSIGYAGIYIASGNPTFNKVSFQGFRTAANSAGLYIGYGYQTILKDCVFAFNSKMIRSAGLTVDNYLINCISDAWTFIWDAGTQTGKVFRQYEFDLNVLNGEITDFVQNANVTLYKDGSKIYSGLTNSSGMIPTQTLTYGYYQQSTGDTIQNATSPYYLVITHPDWQTYVSRFYITQPLRLTVSMQEPTYTGYSEAEKSDYTTIILFVISLILCIIGLALTVPLLPLIALTVSVINVLLLTEISVFNILLIILNIIFTVITIVRTKTKNN